MESNLLQRPFDGARSTIKTIDAGVVDLSSPDWRGLQSDNPKLAAEILNAPVSNRFKAPRCNAETGLYPGGVLGATLSDRVDVYFLPGGLFGSGGLQPGTILHEALHSLTCLGDELLARKLGLYVGPEQDPGAAISQGLSNHGCMGWRR